MCLINTHHFLKNTHISNQIILMICLLIYVSNSFEENLLCFFFGCVHTMWKLPGQGPNARHSSNPSCGSDNSGSLNLVPQENSQAWFLNYVQLRLITSPQAVPFPLLD